MIRKDREIKNMDEILDVLKRCDTVSVGFHGGDYPYVVPVSFGVIRRDDSIALYFHGTKRGLKIDLIESDPRVCVEGHIFHEVVSMPRGLTTRYESVIGFGRAEKVEGDEAVEGLRSIADHHGYAAYPVEQCKSLPATAVYKITLDSVTGKRNI